MPSGTGVTPGTGPATVGPVARRGPVIVRDPDDGRLLPDAGKPPEDGLFFASVIPKPSSCDPKNAYYALGVGAGAEASP
jgi:hypothetical protein